MAAGTKRLQDKVAIVTGAGTGLGRETAKLYAAEGARVVLCDVREDDGRQTARSISDAGGEALFLRADVSRSEEVAGLVATTEKAYGALHIMTANAGILGSATGKHFVDVSDEEFWRVMDVNFRGAYHSFKHAVPAILRAGGGAITATGSLGGHRARGNLAAYGASKAALSGLVRALALDLFPTIRVNEVAPGGMDTEMIAHQAEEGGIVDFGISPRLPGTTIMNASDVARAHLYLVSDEAPWITGQTLFVDGGRSILMATA